MTIVLEGQTRQVGSRQLLREVRNNGQVPAIMYGYNMETTPIAVNAKQVAKLIQTSAHSVLEVAINNEQVNAVISEVQRCALRGTITHIDLQAINMAQELETEVPVALIGEAPGTKVGGVLMQPNTAIRILVKPKDMPEAIEVDVSALEIGQIIAVEDIRAQVPFEIVTEQDYILATILAPTVAEEATEEAVQA